MKNRPRPPISVYTELYVAGMQLLAAGHVALMRAESETLGALLERRLIKLADVLGCERKDLRLDHDPALRVRLFNESRYRAILEQVAAGKLSRAEKWKRVAKCYTPNANDTDHLRYRPHGAQYAGSHHIKTNVRGDHGQFPDRILIKRERRRERAKNAPKARAKKRKFGTSRLGGRGAKIPSRPFPPKGSRPFRRNR